MKKALLLLLLISWPATAQTTVDTAIVIPTFIAPNEDGGIHIEGMGLVETDYGTCTEAVAEAETAMHAEETRLATLYSRADWTAKSYARCYQKRWTVSLTPTTANVQPVTCIRTWTEDFDWFGPCPQ